MSHLNTHGYRGFPGDVLTQIKYTWTDDNELSANISATSTASTPIDITNYCLFNLAGHGTGPEELKRHIVTINSDKCIYKLSSENTISTNSICAVDRTVFDLRKATMLTEMRLRQIPGGGYDHNYCVNSPSDWCYRFHAR